MLVFSLWRMTTACPERLHEGSDGAFRNRTQGGFPSSTGTSDVCNTSKNRKIRLHPFSEVPLEISINLSSFDCFQLFTTQGPVQAAVLDGIVGPYSGLGGALWLPSVFNQALRRQREQ